MSGPGRASLKTPPTTSVWKWTFNWRPLAKRWITGTVPRPGRRLPGHYDAIFMHQAIAPVAECQNDIDMFADLARRVGIEG